MNRSTEPPDFGGIPPMTREIVNAALDREDITAAELMMLYFACATIEPVEEEFGGAPARIANILLDLAEEGDEDAAMALMALNALVSEDVSEEALVVGVEMFRAISTRPILRNVIAEKMDLADAAAALTVINTLAETHGMNLDDPDDADLDELAEILGVSDLEWDGEPDDR